MSDKLKPCPFCGGEAELFIYYDAERVYCIRCGASVEYFGDILDDGFFNGTYVIPMWNRRVSLVDCDNAEHDSNGCLGYSTSHDDEPCDQCKSCVDYTGYCLE